MKKIISILECFNLKGRFEPMVDAVIKDVEFNKTDIILENEIKKAKKYLSCSIEKCLTK